MSDIELTADEKAVLERLVSEQKAEMVMTFAIKGLERFSGSGTAVADVNDPEEVQKLQAQSAATSALLEFYSNLTKITDAM